MTLGRFVLILFLVAAAFITANIALSFANKQGISQLNSDSKACQHCKLNKADLAGWDLSGYDLTQASFIEADLRCANLNKAILAGANMKAANLTGATLEGADLLFTNMDKVVWEDGTDCNDIHPQQG
jgi:uncharacterized protein YjbI with pentapeptide repeats